VSACASGGKLASAAASRRRSVLHHSPLTRIASRFALKALEPKPKALNISADDEELLIALPG